MTVTEKAALIGRPIAAVISDVSSLCASARLSAAQATGQFEACRVTRLLLLLRTRRVASPTVASSARPLPSSHSALEPLFRATDPVSGPSPSPNPVRTEFYGPGRLD